MLKCLQRKINRAALGLMVGAAVMCGCHTQEPSSTSSDASRTAALAAESGSPAPKDASAPAVDTSPSMPLREGNTIKITFPGAPSLDNTVPIRQDGKINLAMVGEVKAAGLTPHELEQELLKVYGNQLIVKQVTVTVESAVFELFVTGAVLRPGKLISDHVETPLQAIIEAGIDQNRANLKKVVIIRQDDKGNTERFPLNLDAVIKNGAKENFVLKPMDTIYVPEKFMWY
jgi:polysaccharide biosynthesis/export protein